MCIVVKSFPGSQLFVVCRRVLNELVSTEKLYVADLKMVKDTYLLHYTNITMTDSVMNKQGVVFVNLESIEKYHSQ